MRVFQMVLGLVIIALGILALLIANRWIAFTLPDITGITLILSGILFIVPALVWRRPLPWLTSLFVPGLLAFAVGAILLYTSRVGLSGAWYLSLSLLVALGLAFLAMYYLGPREQWLWVLGMIVGGIGLFFLSVLVALFSPLAGVRMGGSIILIGMGLLFAFRPLMLRHTRKA